MSSVLVWTSDPYTLSAAAQDIAEVYDAIVRGLPALGYSGITRTGPGVWGYNAGKDLGIAVFFPFIGGRSFWRVVVCGGGGDGAQAGPEVDKVKTMINGIGSL